MTHPLRLVLVLHNHQPIGNFDGVFEQAYHDSYLPFLDVARSLCSIADGADEAAGKRAIGATIDRLGLSEEKVAPYLHNLLSYKVDDPVFSRLTPELVRRRTVEAQTALLFAEAAAAPLALIIEDVHWIDTATEEVIGAVVEALSEIKRQPLTPENRQALIEEFTPAIRDLERIVQRDLSAWYRN